MQNDNKVILINGVNVAGCKYYDDGNCCNDDVLTLSCEKAYCMYKQLKRLEQENERLKKVNENYKLYGSSTIVAPVNHTNTEYNLLYGQSMLYKSALEEIREDFMCFRTCILPFHTGDKDKIPHSMADVIQDYCESIKNKIDEVLNDSEG